MQQVIAAQQAMRSSFEQLRKAQRLDYDRLRQAQRCDHENLRTLILQIADEQQADCDSLGEAQQRALASLRKTLLLAVIGCTLLLAGLHLALNAKLMAALESTQRQTGQTHQETQVGQHRQPTPTPHP